MFTYKRKIRLVETDAAGIVFFSNYFLLFNEAYEAFLDSAGVGLTKIIQSNKYHLPIARAECDYKSPLFLTDTIEIKLTIERIGESSFVLLSRFIKEDKTCAAIIKTVHVSTDAKTRKKIPLPKDFRDKMTKICNHRQ